MERNASELHEYEDSIRQIAILLNSLPDRTHRVLLGQLGTDDKRRIADELSSIGEIDALEQHRVLKRMHGELQAETSSVEKVESEIQDEIQIGRARVSKKRPASVYSAGETNTDVFADKPHASSTAAKSISGKPTAGHQPSPITPHSANAPEAKHLPFQTQADVVTGQAAIHPTTEMLQSMFAQFHQTQAAGVLPSNPSHFSNGNQEAGTAEKDALNEAAHILPMTGVKRSQQSESPDVFENAKTDSAELAERVDRFLTQLPTQELCRALGMATTKQAFLVLCGLPNETSETVLEMLPRRQARKVRNDMRRMGQLQLSEIDAAKQVVAQIAIRLTGHPKSFAA